MSFFEMGGYAAYVWPAFGIAAVIMIVLLVLSVRGMRARESALRELEAERGGRRQRARRAAGGAAGDASGDAAEGSA